MGLDRKMSAVTPVNLAKSVDGPTGTPPTAVVDTAAVAGTPGPGSGIDAHLDTITPSPEPSSPPLPVSTESLTSTSSSQESKILARLSVKGIDAKSLLFCFRNYVEYLKNTIAKWGASVNMQRDAQERQLQYTKKYVHLLEQQLEQEEGITGTFGPCETGSIRSNPEDTKAEPKVEAKAEAKAEPDSKVDIRATLSQGDCFFSGIYRRITTSSY